MNVWMGQMTVTSMPSVPTHLELTHASVNQASQEMGQAVQVQYSKLNI